MLGPSESLQTSIQLSFFDDSKSIAAIAASIAQQQAGHKPQIHQTPQPGFSFT
jgi:hypothetical protein